MSLVSRANNTVALECDNNGCHMEVLGPDDASAKEDANLIGWKFLEKGTRHICPDCTAGVNTAAVARYGAETMETTATVAYAADDPFHHPQTGEMIGRVKAAAKPGEAVTIVMMTPEQVAERRSAADNPHCPESTDAEIDVMLDDAEALSFDDDSGVIGQAPIQPQPPKRVAPVFDLFGPASTSWDPNKRGQS